LEKTPKKYRKNTKNHQKPPKKDRPTVLVLILELKKIFFKGCPGRGANPRSFDFVYFLIPLLYRRATSAPHLKISLNALKPLEICTYGKYLR
jgi:hypothetical protein